MRESPAVEIMELLQGKGADIAYSDPHVPIFPPMRTHHFELESITVSDEALRSHDVVLIATDHDAFDYDAIRNQAQLVVDSRGVYRQPYSNVVKA